MQFRKRGIETSLREPPPKTVKSVQGTLTRRNPRHLQLTVEAVAGWAGWRSGWFWLAGWLGSCWLGWLAVRLPQAGWLRLVWLTLAHMRAIHHRGRELNTNTLGYSNLPSAIPPQPELKAVKQHSSLLWAIQGLCRPPEPPPRRKAEHQQP